MYYATFKNIGITDITGFKTEQERDDWVNFKDPLSKALDDNADNCTFERTAIATEEAEQRIGAMLHKEDDFNIGQEWYIVI